MTDNTKFLYDLQKLLEKYKVDITVDDHWTGYAECGQDLRISFDFEDSYEILEFKYVDAEILIDTLNQRIINND